MYEIEFNSEMTIEGILSSFKNLKEANIESYIEIDGNKIFYDDVNLERRVREEYKKYHETHKKEIEAEMEIKKEEKELRSPIDEALHEKINIYKAMHDKKFLYELGVFLEYIKGEYKNKILDRYLYLYTTKENYEILEICRDLDYVSTLLLIMEDDIPLIKKRIKIQGMLNSICGNETEIVKFGMAIGMIEKYAIHGEKIKELLYLDVLNEKLEQNENKIKKLIDDEKKK